MMIHRYLFVLLFICPGKADAQVVHRAYASLNYGYLRHGEMGLYAHGLNHLCASYYFGTSRKNTGPVYHPGTGLISFGKQLKNTYYSHNLLAGVTTRTYSDVDCSLMAGLSWTKALEHENFEVYENEYSHAESISSDLVTRNALGMAIRFDLHCWIGEFAAFNIAVQTNLNSIRNELQAMVGVSLGWKAD